MKENTKFEATYAFVSLNKVHPSKGIDNYSGDDVIEILSEFISKKQENENFPYDKSDSKTKKRFLFIENMTLERKCETYFACLVLMTAMFISVTILYLTK